MPSEGEWTVVGSIDGRPSGGNYDRTPTHWLVVDSVGLALDDDGGVVVAANPGPILLTSATPLEVRALSIAYEGSNGTRLKHFWVVLEEPTEIVWSHWLTDRPRTARSFYEFSLTAEGLPLSQYTCGWGPF